MKERLGLPNIAAMSDLIIQHQGYTGSAVAHASNNTSVINDFQKQFLRFKDLYHNPVIIGQGAFGIVVSVDRIQKCQMSENSNNAPQGKASKGSRMGLSIQKVEE
jgi:hypothetical protein